MLLLLQLFYYGNINGAYHTEIAWMISLFDHRIVVSDDVLSKKKNSCAILCTRWR